MKKISRFMKKYASKWWFWTLCAVLFLIVIQILFSIPAPCKWLEAVWDAGDFISFTGTMILGFVAIWQTQRANGMSERLMELEYNRYKMEIRPFVMVTDWKAYELNRTQILLNPNKLYIAIGQIDDGKSDDVIGLGLRFQNTTNSYVSVEYKTAYSQKITWSNSAGNQPNRKLRLLASKDDEMVFYAKKDFMSSLIGEHIIIQIILENRFGERYQESFELIVSALFNHCLHNNGEWYCDAATQNYQIGRFEKDDSGKIVLIMEEKSNGQTKI